MTDKRDGLIYRPLKFLLLLVSLIYGFSIVLRTLLYRYGIFKTGKVPIKIISVGNLTLGGTGKTPFVMMLARGLKDELDRRVSVLIRGYGWDEQAMLKKNLPDIPIVVGEDRTRSARRAIRIDGSDTAILDDGFQYWELGRDLEIVLIDSRNPFGNCMLFPRGVLREPKTAVSRADIVVFTKADKSVMDITVIRDELRRMNPALVFLEARHRPRYIYDCKTNEQYDLGYVRGKRTVLISSIGDPEYFEETIKDLGATVIDHMKFPDHYDYRPRDIDKIMRLCKDKEFDIMMTTEKDAVKLNRLRLSTGDYHLKTLAVEMEITSGREEFLARLCSLYSG